MTRKQQQEIERTQRNERLREEARLHDEERVRPFFRTHPPLFSILKEVGQKRRMIELEKKRIEDREKRFFYLVGFFSLYFMMTPLFFSAQRRNDLMQKAFIKPVIESSLIAPIDGDTANGSKIGDDTDDAVSKKTSVPFYPPTRIPTLNLTFRRTQAVSSPHNPTYVPSPTRTQIPTPSLLSSSYLLSPTLSTTSVYSTHSSMQSNIQISTSSLPYPPISTSSIPYPPISTSSFPYPITSTSPTSIKSPSSPPHPPVSSPP